MHTRLTTKPEHEVIAAIQALDLEVIKLRMMDVESGEGWSGEYANRIESEYKTFLTMLVRHPEAMEDILVSKDVDEFWHNHILHTMKYAADCQAVFGNFLHHNPQATPQSSADAQKRRTAAEKTRRLYQQHAQAAYCNASAYPREKAYCNASIAAAAYCNATIHPGKAAYCNATAPRRQATYCNASAASSAAYCNATVQTVEIAYCNASWRADHAAYCNASAGYSKAAYCNAAVEAHQEADAYCNATAGPSAYCNASAAPDHLPLAYCNASKGN